MKLSSKGRKKQCNMSKLIAAGIPLAAMLSAGANAAEVKYKANVTGKMLLREPDRRKYHTVKPDENLSIIAKKYQTTVKKLCELKIHLRDWPKGCIRIITSQLRQ
jgi:LysM repeat protein